MPFNRPTCCHDLILVSDITNYEVIRKLGRGKYSEVFQGVNMKTGQPVVLKSLRPLSKKKVLREKYILDKLHNCENIINLLDIVKDDLSRTISFVFDYVDSEFYKEQYAKFTDHDVRMYMYLCLKVKASIHSKTPRLYTSATLMESCTEISNHTTLSSITRRRA